MAATISKIEPDRAYLKEFADTIRALADRYEAGEISEIVVIGNDRESRVYFEHSEFADRWRLIGSLEYAKLSVVNG